MTKEEKAILITKIRLAEGMYATELPHEGNSINHEDIKSYLFFPEDRIGSVDLGDNPEHLHKAIGYLDGDRNFIAKDGTMYKLPKEGYVPLYGGCALNALENPEND